MADAISFMRVRALSVPAMLLCIVAEGAYRAFLDLKTPFIIIGASALMNISLNFAFIFGVLLLLLLLLLPKLLPRGFVLLLPLLLLFGRPLPSP